MKIKAGAILISAPSLDESIFEKVVIFIAEYNEKGALGFVINKLFPRRFNELLAYRDSIPFSLYEGGPVENEHLYFLHQRPDLINGGTLIVDSIYLGGDFEQAVKCIDTMKINMNDIKLFIGYCGWDPHQLEEEINEGSWLVSNVDVENVFAHPTETLWDDIYAGNDFD